MWCLDKSQAAQPRAKLSRAAVRWALTSAGRTHALTTQHLCLFQLHHNLLRRVIRELPHGHPFCPATSSRNYSEQPSQNKRSEKPRPPTTTRALFRGPHFPQPIPHFVKCATQLDPSQKAPSSIRSITTRWMRHAQYELARTQPRPPRYTRGGLVNDVRGGQLRTQTRGPLRRILPVLSPPPRHPRRIAVRGRRGRVGLETELRRSLGDAIHQEVLIPIVAVLAHDRAELRQLAIPDAHDRVTPTPHDLVQPVGKQRDISREREHRTRDVRARIHRREVEDVRRRDQDLGQERVHGDP